LIVEDDVTAARVVVSGISSQQAKLTALGFGTDYYITKPYDGRNWLRAGRVERRSKGFSKPTLQFGTITLNQLNLDNLEVFVHEFETTVIGTHHIIGGLIA